MPKGHYARPSPELCFWRKVTFSDGCWEWTASKNMHGYGEFRVAGKLMKAHRFAYELVCGPIPDGMVTDHICRNRSCVNPAHLEIVTQAENVRRGDAAKDKTHCRRGHELTGKNLYVYPDGRRLCRTCHNDGNRRRREAETR